MIAYINGPITHKSPTYVVIDIMGIGYHVNISLHTYDKISGLGSCKLLVHQVIKEDAHQLFGFYDEEERELFRHLIGISGVGPNTARMMLSSLSPEDLKRAIIGANITLIKSVKGVGPKTAQRIIIELQDVLQKSGFGDMSIVIEKTRTAEEALGAMQALGFPRAQAEKAIAASVKSLPAGSVEDLIKQALKLI